MLLLALTSNPVVPSFLTVTDTTRIQLPINAVLAGQQDMLIAETVIERRDPNIRTRTTIAVGGSGKLSDGVSSFKTTRTRRGYD